MTLMRLAPVALVAISCGFTAPAETTEDAAEAVLMAEPAVADPVAQQRLQHEVTLALLQDLGIGALDIKVGVEGDGEVALSGTVGTAHERQRARNSVWEYPGVTDVVDGLAVMPPEKAGPVDSRVEMLDKKLDARLLANQVELALLEFMGPSALDIQATASEGSVVLAGTVPTQDDIDTALRITDSMTEVKAVTTELAVSPGS